MEEANDHEKNINKKGKTNQKMEWEKDKKHMYIRSSEQKQKTIWSEFHIKKETE